MTSYTATFSKGETKSIANSTRDYRAAWLIEIHDTTGDAPDRVIMGFAATRAMAEKAAHREFTSLNSAPTWGWRRHRSNAPPRWALVRSEAIDIEGVSQ